MSEDELNAADLDRSDMARLAGGRDASLNDLMERHAPRLYNYLLRQVSDESEANDLTQETFVKVYLNRTKFRAESKFSTWLYTIATNLARDHFRRRGRRPEVSLEARDEQHQSLGEVLPEKSGSPIETLIAEERSQQVRAAVQALPEDLRVPLILAEYEDQSHAEIASILNCTTKAVEMRIYHARQALRKVLSNLVEMSM
jgi:RNA polymerase sigma-70 factor, ECF subfamily